MLFNMGLLLGAALGLPELAQACAVCVGSDGSDPVVDAFKWSVLFMMATPYAVFGAIGGWIYYRYRRSAREQAGDTNVRGSSFNWIWTHRESER
jgi:hypothetical protein